MKKRIVSFLCAAALVLSLAGCTLTSTPDTVGKLGDTEISAGMYLLSQYQGYFAAVDYLSAQPVAEGETPVNYSAMPVKELLQQKITLEGETVTAADYVAQRTLENLQYFAGVNYAFDALDGKLSDEQLAAAQRDAKSIWDANTELYQKNGFSLATIEEYQETVYKADELMQMIYGKDGTHAVSDEELLARLDEDMRFVHTASVPLYNMESFQIVDENTAKVTGLCQKMLDDFNAAKADTTDVPGLFKATLEAGMPAVYEIVGNTFVPGNTVRPDLLDSTAFEQYFDAEDANTIRALEVGEAAMLTSSGMSVDFFLRVDPTATGEWEMLRQPALYAAYGQKLQDELQHYAADELENTLDASAMSKLPAEKIVPSVG